MAELPVLALDRGLFISHVRRIASRWFFFIILLLIYLILSPLCAALLPPQTRILRLQNCTMGMFKSVLFPPPPTPPIPPSLAIAV